MIDTQNDSIQSLNFGKIVSCKEFIVMHRNLGHYWLHSHVYIYIFMKDAQTL